MENTVKVLNVKCNKWYVIVILISQCSATKPPLRIYNGTDANADEYSYVVRIEVQRQFFINSKKIAFQQEHLCTASALSSIWVISAAHCIDGVTFFHSGRQNSTEKLVIRYGHVERLPWINDSFSEVLFAVRHPLYSPSYPISNLRVQSKHDICLLKTSLMNIKSYVKLSAVDYKSTYGHEAVVAGFGITTKLMPEGKFETDDTLRLKKPLQVLKVLITKCYYYHSVAPGLCLSPRCGQVTTVCGGDSGGPLIHLSGLIGVLSQGEASGFCLDDATKGPVNIAGIIVPTSQYIEWIYSFIIRS